MSTVNFLPALSHAVSGAAGSAISTSVTYPLDLVTTRLKAQRQLVAEGSLDSADSYAGVVDAFRRIWAAEGGPGAFYAGLAQDLAKSAVDSFLFFLFYNWFRARRLAARRSRRHLPVLDELAVGAAAGACARAFTTPISNVVTRMQTARLVSGQDELEGGGGHGNGNGGDAGRLSVRSVIDDIRREKGIRGLWSGYSANLVLTLNPSLTFLFNQILEKALVPVTDSHGWQGDHPAAEVGAAAIFFLAATSKAIATAITYPFQIAKARVQVSTAPAGSHTEKASKDATNDNLIQMDDEKADLGKEKDPSHEEQTTSSTSKRVIRSTASSLRDLAEDSIFGTLVRIVQTEGVRALYDGIGGELLKAFFNHGTTMLSKDLVHKLLVRLYFVGLAALRRYPETRYRVVRTSQNITQQLLRLPTASKDMLSHGGAQAQVRATYRRGELIVHNMLEGGQRSIGRIR